VIVEMDAPRVDLAETQALRARLRAAVPAAG